MPLLGQRNQFYSIGGFWVHSWWWRWRRGRRRRVCVHKLHFPGTGISSSTMHQIHAMHGLASPSCMSPNLQFKFYCLDVLLRLGLGSFIIVFAKFNFTVTAFYCKETFNILKSCSLETRDYLQFWNLFFTVEEQKFNPGKKWLLNNSQDLPMYYLRL